MTINNELHAQLFVEVAEIIKDIQGKVNDETDVVWTKYRSVKELYTVLNNFLERAGRQDRTLLNELQYEFLPTASFQELSISNGWGHEYLTLAERFDKIYQQA